MGKDSQEWRYFFRHILAIKRDPGCVRASITMSIPIIIALIIAGLIFNPSHAILGALIVNLALVGYPRPLRTRCIYAFSAFIIAEIQAFMVMNTADIAFLGVGIMIACVTVNLWGWYACDLPPIVRPIFLMNPIMCWYLADHGISAGPVMLISAVEWCIAMLISMALACMDRYRYERDSVEKLEQAADHYIEWAHKTHTDNSPEIATLDKARLALYMAFHQAGMVFYPAYGHKKKLPPLIADYEDRICAVYTRVLSDIEQRYYNPEGPRHTIGPFGIKGLGVPSLGYRIRRCLALGNPGFNLAISIALTLIIVYTLPVIIPTAHPNWAALSAVIAVHLGMARFDTIVYGMQRFFGTCIGVCVYAALSPVTHNAWVKIAVFSICLLFLLAFIRKNYGISCIFITTFALTITPTKPGVTVEFVVQERIVETFIGVVTGMIIYCLINRPLRALNYQFRITVQALQNLAYSMKDDSREKQASSPYRRRLLWEINAMATVTARTLADAPSLVAPWMSTQRELIRIAAMSIAAQWRNIHRNDEDTQNASSAAAAILWHALEDINATYRVTPHNADQAPHAARDLHSARHAFIDHTALPSDRDTP